MWLTTCEWELDYLAQGPGKSRNRKLEIHTYDYVVNQALADHAVIISVLGSSFRMPCTGGAFS